MSLVSVLESLILPIVILAVPLVWARLQDSFTPSSRLRRRIIDHQALLKDVPVGEASNKLQEEIDRQIDDLVTYWEGKRQAGAHGEEADSDSPSRAPTDRGVLSSILILGLTAISFVLAGMVLFDQFTDRYGAADLDTSENIGDPDSTQTDDDSMPTNSGDDFFPDVERAAMSLRVGYDDCVNLDSKGPDWGARAAGRDAALGPSRLVCFNSEGLVAQRSKSLADSPNREQCAKAAITERPPIAAGAFKGQWICMRTAEGRLASVNLRRSQDGKGAILRVWVWKLK